MWLTLRGHSLTPGERIQSRSTKMDLMERSATASPEITGDSPPAVGEWIKRLSGPGKGIIWRVKTVEDSRFTSAGYTLQLEHIIATLKDLILPGETTPATITGNKNATSCTARQAINYILSFQSDWKLGTLEEEKTAPYSFNGETLFDCIETVCSALKDVYWDFDLSSYPFILDIRKIGSAVGSEMRLNRNITGQIRKTIDRSGMYTRIFPIGKNNLKLPEGSLSKNTGTYGTIDHTETDGSMDTVDKLRAWAQERLDRHCEPKVTVSVTGLELSGWTGEDLDNIKLNRVCRLPLQKYNTVIRERVTKLSWADADGNPESVTVILANTRDDVASIIRNISKSGGKGSRVSAQKDEEDHAWFEDTTDHVSMVAEAIIGQSPDGVDWKRVAELTVDGLGIHGRVTKTEGDMIIAQAAIEVNEEAITAEVKRATGEEGKLTVRADQIEGRVSTAEGNIATLNITAEEIEARVETAEGKYGEIEVTSRRVGMVVGTKDGEDYIKAGEICVAINDSGESEATIKASKIYLLGQTIANTISADYVKAKIADIPQLIVSNLDVTGALRVSTGQYSQNVTAAIWDLNIKNNGNNTYTLQRKRMSDGEWVDVGTFSGAVTPTLSGSWSGGTLTVTSNPAPASTFKRALSAGAKETSGGDPYNGEKTFYVPIQSYQTGVTPPTYENTGYRAYVDATKTYDAGMSAYKSSANWAKATAANSWLAKIPTETDDGSEDWDCGAQDAYKAAANAVRWPSQVSGQTSHVNFSFTVPNNSLGTSSRTYTLSRDSAGCYVYYGSTLVANIVFD